jgi:EF-hand domain
LIKLFKLLDTNKSGTLSLDEVRLGLANLGTYSDLSYIMQQVSVVVTATYVTAAVTDTTVTCTQCKSSAACMHAVCNGSSTHASF